LADDTVELGGVSIFSPREGFICDNVVNHEIVLSSGDILNANTAENSVLWNALRGGGNNFGFVIRFDLRTFKQGPSWGGIISYLPPRFASQVQAYCHELHKPDGSNQTHITDSRGFGPTYHGTSRHYCVTWVYHTRQVERLAVLDPFVSFEPQRTEFKSMRMMTLKEAANELAPPSSYRAKYVLQTLIDRTCGLI
jgi:hypothetical protein